MNQSNPFRQLERKTYLRYHQDGIIDIIISLCVLGFGINMTTTSATFSIFSWLPILFFTPLKNKITVPRFGYVKFDQRRSTARNVIAFLVGVGVLAVLVGFVVFLIANRGGLGRMDWLGDNLMLFLAGFGAFVLAIPAALIGVKRLFAYAGLCLLLVGSARFLPLYRPLPVLLLGVIILTTGVVLLVRFIRKYPLITPEDIDDLSH